jgi:type I restriction enzyme M protein
MKTTDVSPALRPFTKLFNQLAYRHDDARVFDDYLTAMLNYFTFINDPTYNTECFSKYTAEERQLFMPMIVETLQVIRSKINDQKGSWYDFFGDFYQQLASKSKQSALGQFFTPEHLVDMMVMIQTEGKDQTAKGLSVSDPTCGSARMLIAFHAHFPGNKMYGEDIDPICCKMASLNMMLHGCQGEIVQHDSLGIDDFRAGWKINPFISSLGVPHILPISKHQSDIMRKNAHRQQNPIHPSTKGQQIIAGMDQIAKAQPAAETTLFSEKAPTEKPNAEGKIVVKPILDQSKPDQPSQLTLF